MTSRLLALISIFVVISSVYAQPDSLWSRGYGGSGFDFGNSILRSNGGGYTVAGLGHGFRDGSVDMLLLKIRTDGDSLWSRVYGGSGSDYCSDLYQLDNDDYVLAGSTNSFGAGNYDGWLVKTDESGDSLWSRTYGSEEHSEKIVSLLPTPDGGFLLAGYQVLYGNGSSDFWVVRADSSGNCLWQHTFGGVGREECRDVCATSDGGYILAGITESFGSGSLHNPDLWMVKINATGDSLWSRAYGGDRWDDCYSVLQTEEGNIVLAGSTRSFGSGYTDFWLVNTDQNGDSLWIKTYGSRETEYCYRMIQTADHGFILAGSSSVSSRHVWIVKTDANGDSLWNQRYNVTPLPDVCYDIKQISDGGFVLTGYHDSFEDVFSSTNVLVLRTSPDTLLTVLDHALPYPVSFYITAYPNPFNSELTLDVSGFSREVRVSLLNVLGQEVEIIHDGVLSGNRIHYAAPSSMSSGLYFVQARDARAVRTEKVVFLK